MAITTRHSVKFVDAALSIRVENGEEHVVLRGVLNPDSLDLLQVGSYQRERLASAGGTAALMLYSYILDHLNKGRRTRRLVDPSLVQLYEEADEESAEETAAV